MRVAAIAFPLRAYPDFAAFAAQWRRQVQAAAAAGARLAVCGEYLTGPLTALDPAWGSWTAPFTALGGALARETGVAVVATHLVEERGRRRNRAFLFTPGGAVLHQDKLHPTPWERGWGVQGGNGLTLFALPTGRRGRTVRAAILTCYDIEFPGAASAAAAAGADLLLVPSWTDDRHGHWRVRHCAQARCVEHQLFAVHAPLVGGAPTIPEFEQASGRAGILSPCDATFPPGGILAEGGWDRPAVVVADLDLARLAEIRAAGTVTPRLDARPAATYRVRGTIAID